MEGGRVESETALLKANSDWSELFKSEDGSGVQTIGALFLRPTRENPTIPFSFLISDVSDMPVITMVGRYDTRNVESNVVTDASIVIGVISFSARIILVIKMKHKSGMHFFIVPFRYTTDEPTN